MKRTLLFGVVLSLIWMARPVPAWAANHPENPPSAGGLPLCLPASDLLEPGDCLHQGPAHYLSQMAALGLTFPPRPLPARPADPSFAAVPFRYAQVVRGSAPVFASLEAAVQGEPVLRRIEPGFDFVTYIDAAEVGGKRYYMVDQGIWMRASDLSRLGATGSFQGLVFRATPRVQFGWVRNQVEARRTPGYFAEDGTGQIFYRYDVVQVYDVKKADGVDWYLVGPDQWLEGRQVGRVIPNPKPPEGVKNGRWIEVNLAEQTVAVYDRDQLVFATLVATGREGAWTQQGLFKIYLKKDAETMQGAFTADRSDYYYLEDVPWTMYFDQARALHGTYWHNRFSWPQSRGCVNLSPGDANWLFQWAREGDWVYVWDPSGKTPTDPSLYGAGGA
jgi:hypothetical protein